MSATIRLDVKVPVRVSQQQMQAYCDAFNLTLQSYSIEGGHSLDVTVAEEVSPETQAQIAAAMSQQMAGSIVTLR